jgi:hypothetical protein
MPQPFQPADHPMDINEKTQLHRAQHRIFYGGKG